MDNRGVARMFELPEFWLVAENRFDIFTLFKFLNRKSITICLREEKNLIF